MSDRKMVPVKLTEDQWKLAKRRLFVEHQTWQVVLSALVNAYICGDITVTRDGRYSMNPPEGASPVVEVPKGADYVEIEPDWQVPQGKPQKGYENREYDSPAPGWGTRQLQQHLRKHTGRGLKLPALRELLRYLEIEKEGHRYLFDGPTDERVDMIETAIHTGVYDALVRKGLKQADKYREQKIEEQEEIEKSAGVYKESKRLKRLKQMRSIEDQ